MLASRAGCEAARFDDSVGSLEMLNRNTPSDAFTWSVPRACQGTQHAQNSALSIPTLGVPGKHTLNMTGTLSLVTGTNTACPPGPRPPGAYCGVPAGELSLPRGTTKAGFVITPRYPTSLCRGTSAGVPCVLRKQILRRICSELSTAR